MEIYDDKCGVLIINQAENQHKIFVFIKWFENDFRWFTFKNEFLGRIVECPLYFIRSNKSSPILHCIV